MRSWRFHKFGSINELTLDDIAVPEPAEDECLVKMAYAGLNPADRLLVMGLYPTTGTPPFSIGRDGSGTIVKPGKSGRFKKGDRVVFLRGIVGIIRDGTMAEYTSVPEAHITLMPEWWTFKQGAASPLVLLTCWQALKETAGLKAAETVLITGASGGIGIGSLLLAKLMGAGTIVFSRSETKRSRLLDLGADHAFNPGDEDLINKVKDLGGADIIIENICGSHLNKSLLMANPYGRVCIIGALGGINSRIDPTTLIFKRIQIHGIQVAMYSDEGVHKAWREICDLIKPAKEKILIDKIFPFDCLPAAFDHLKQGPMGKVLIGPMDRSAGEL